MFIPSATTARGALAAGRVAPQEGRALGGPFCFSDTRVAMRFSRTRRRRLKARVAMRLHGALLLVLASLSAHAAPDAYQCPRTVGPHGASSGGALPEGPWYGSSALAVALPVDGYWTGTGPENDFRGKLFWWSHGYDAHRDPYPALVVEGHRLDAESKPASTSRTTNVLGSTRGMDGMLHLITFPAEGCWKVTGRYRGQSLDFVLEVVGSRPE